MGVTRIWSQCKSFMTISKTIRQFFFQISTFKKILEGLTPKKEKNRLIHEIRKDIRCKMIIHMGKCSMYILEILFKSSIFDFIFLYLVLKNCQKGPYTKDVTHLGEGVCQKVTLVHKAYLVKWVTLTRG